MYAPFQHGYLRETSHTERTGHRFVGGVSCSHHFKLDVLRDILPEFFFFFFFSSADFLFCLFHSDLLIAHLNVFVVVVFFVCLFLHLQLVLLINARMVE